MATAHWTWESQPYQLEGRDGPVTVGKKNAINNFCIGIQGNWPGCTSCHAGYGWEDANFDFNQEQNVDCLVCHDNTGTYVKGYAGLPVEGVDLLDVARSVANPPGKTAAAATSKVAAEMQSNTAIWMRPCISPHPMWISTWASMISYVRTAIRQKTTDIPGDRSPSAWMIPTRSTAQTAIPRISMKMTVSTPMWIQ